MIDFDNHIISLEGKPVLKVSAAPQASPQQRLDLLLEIAAHWVFEEKLDLEEAVEHLRAEYEQLVTEEAEQRRRGLYVVPSRDKHSG